MPPHKVMHIILAQSTDRISINHCSGVARISK